MFSEEYVCVCRKHSVFHMVSINFSTVTIVILSCLCGNGPFVVVYFLFDGHHFKWQDCISLFLCLKMPTKRIRKKFCIELIQFCRIKWCYRVCKLLSVIVSATRHLHIGITSIQIGGYFRLKIRIIFRGAGTGPADPTFAGPIISAHVHDKVISLRCYQLNCDHGRSGSLNNSFHRQMCPYARKCTLNGRVHVQ